MGIMNDWMAPYLFRILNSQLETPNSKVDVVLKKRFETFILKISGICTK